MTPSLGEQQIYKMKYGGGVCPFYHKDKGFCPKGVNLEAFCPRGVFVQSAVEKITKST